MSFPLIWMGWLPVIEAVVRRTLQNPMDLENEITAWLTANINRYIIGAKIEMRRKALIPKKTEYRII